jgi:uncharacterized membrane protein (UPF0127 family)
MEKIKQKIEWLMKNPLVWIIIGLFLAWGFLYKPLTNLSNQQKMEANSVKTLAIGTTTLNIEVANTNEAREKGLSGRSGLAPNEGMLFIFREPGYYGFWMKDMKFPIDIAWLDQNKKIIFIAKDVSPYTYPQVFMPTSTPALYVLETGAGFFENHNLKIGDTAQF